MAAQYPPGTLLTRDEDEPFSFRGPDGKVYHGLVSCTEFNPDTATFIPRVPEPEPYTWRERITQKIGHRLGLLRRVHGTDGEITYTTKADAGFLKAIYGDKIKID